MKIPKRWRGMQANRLAEPDNKLERRFAREWHHVNTAYGGDRGNTPSVLDSLLDPSGRGDRAGVASDRDRQVACTVIQWLGSTIGSTWVRDVLKEHDAAVWLTDSQMDLLVELGASDRLTVDQRQEVRAIIRVLEGKR